MQNYDYSTAGMYFVTICTKNKEKLFGTVTDGDLFELPKMQLSRIGKIVDEQIQTIQNAQYVSLENYVVMPNHLHMILLLEDGTAQKQTAANAVLPHTIGSFKRFCAQRIGQDVFQRSFHDRIIRNQREFEKIWTYIEDNPRRWKEDVFYIPD